jgi:TPP-dependent pyruvate/acetoin dehydrogenase alpha subunit
MDFDAVRESTKAAVDRGRRGLGPQLIEAVTYRLIGHSRGDPLYGPYRTKEEFQEWQERDPIARYASRVGLPPETKVRLDDQASRAVEAAVEFALRSPFPDQDEVRRDVSPEAEVPA